MLLTYHCRLVGNSEKLIFLNRQYKYVQIVARYILKYIRATKEYRKGVIHKNTYFKIRKKYPFLYSKMVEHIRDKVLSSVKAKKLYKVRRIKMPLIFDYQNFNVKFEDGYYNAFLRFQKHNFPLEGKYTLEKIHDKYVKEIQVKKVGRGWRVYFICYVAPENNVKCEKKFGVDINVKNVTLSDNKRCDLKEYFHRKKEFRKKKQKLKIINYSRDVMHKTTSRLVKYLVESGGSEVILEDLTNIRKSVTKKKRKGKNFNYTINNAFPFRMFQTFLEYKCKLQGLGVRYVNPRNTSRTCRYCGSLSTARPRQSLLICNSCGKRQNADLTGAINIQGFSLLSGDMNDSHTLSSVNKEETYQL